MKQAKFSLLRWVLGGLAGGIGWTAGLTIFFGPAQALLGDPSLQSAKFLAAFGTEPLPYTATRTWLLPVGLIVLALFHSAVYRVIGRNLPGDGWWRRGLTFGLIAWALSFPWFEFYLPWNVMHEPWPLVALELACWLGTMLVVGLGVAFAHEFRNDGEQTVSGSGDEAP